MVVQSRVYRGYRRKERSVRVAILLLCHISLSAWSEKEGCGLLRLAGEMPNRPVSSSRLSVVSIVFHKYFSRFSFSIGYPHRTVSRTFESFLVMSLFLCRSALKDVNHGGQGMCSGQILEWFERVCYAPTDYFYRSSSDAFLIPWKCTKFNFVCSAVGANSTPRLLSWFLSRFAVGKWE